jgi:hypothetical protein
MGGQMIARDGTKLPEGPFVSRIELRLVLGIVLVAAAMSYWLWSGLTQRSIDGDEGISILAGRGVLEHGWPELPSGLLYRKGIVSSYLLGGAFALFGVNDFSNLLPALLFASGSLVLVMLLARDLSGSSYLGVVAGAWLVLIETQSRYATSPRMYAALQFFALLALYGAWHGWSGKKRGIVIALLALGGAVLSHAQSAALFVAIPFACFAAGSRPRLLRSTQGLIVLGFVIWGMLWLWTGLSQQISSPRIADAGGSDPRNFDPAIDLGRVFAQLWALESTAPLSIAFAPLVVLVVARAWRRRDEPGSRGLRFAFAWLSVCALLTLFAIGPVDSRFWMMTLPVYLLLLCVALVRWIGVLIHSSRRSMTLQAMGFGAWVVALVASVSWVYGPERYPEMIAGAYRVPGSGVMDRNALSVKLAHQKLADTLLPADRIVSTNPWVTHYYLGRVDAFLRERREEVSPVVKRQQNRSLQRVDKQRSIGRPGDEPNDRPSQDREDAPQAWRFGSFGNAVDEYLGIQLVDTADELTELKEASERVWIVTDSKFQNYSSPETLRRVAGEFILFHSDASVQIYTNRSFPGAAAEHTR